MAINTNTETWVTVRKHCEERIDALRVKLEGDISNDESIKLSAQLRELRSIVALGVADTPLVDEPDMLPE